jgi:hypothetical protein
VRIIVAGQRAVSTDEFTELALGIDAELFSGVADESGPARLARLSVAREVLAELSQQDPKDARFVRSLMSRSTRRHLSERRAA